MVFDFLHPQGPEMMVMQSHEDADAIIALFCSAKAQGYEDPQAIAEEIFYQAGVDPADLLDNDRMKINEVVNNLWS